MLRSHRRPPPPVSFLQYIHPFPKMSSDFKSVCNFWSYARLKLRNKHIFNIFFQFFFNFSNFLISSWEMNSSQKTKLFAYNLFISDSKIKQNESFYTSSISKYWTDRHWFRSNQSISSLSRTQKLLIDQ